MVLYLFKGYLLKIILNIISNLLEKTCQIPNESKVLYFK